MFIEYFYQLFSQMGDSDIFFIVTLNNQQKIYNSLMSNNKIIRDENSLLSELSNISPSIEYRKNQGFSLFCPSAQIKDYKKERSEFLQQQIIPDQLDDISLLCGLGFSKFPNSFDNQPLQRTAKQNWVSFNDPQAQGVSQNEENEDQPDQNDAAQNKLVIVPEIPKPNKRTIHKKQSTPVKQQVHEQKTKSSDKKENKKRKRIKKGQKKTKGYMKNQTKNIPKNFGKAIISFIEKNQSLLKPYIDKIGSDWYGFIEKLMDQKKRINTIADLRKLWTQYSDAKLVRIYSNIFLRKFGHQYVFHSRVSNVTVHLKYRRRLADAIKNPQDFVHIKEY